MTERDAGGRAGAGSGGLTRERIEQWLIERIARHVGADKSQIDCRANLARYNIDSSDVVAIVIEIEEWIGRPLSPTLLYEYTSIQAVTDHLAAETGLMGPEARGG